MTDDRNIFENVLNLLSECDKVVIYGAGRYGQLLLKQFYDWGIYKKGCFAETVPGETKELLGWDVCSISDFKQCDERTVVIVAVGIKLMDEMLLNLQQLDVKNYVELTDDMRRVLRNFEQQIPSRQIMQKLLEQNKFLKDSSAKYMSSIEQIRGNVNQLQNSVTQHQSSLVQYQNNFAQHENNLQQLQNSVKQLQQDVKQAQTSVGQVQNNIVQLQKDIKAIPSQIEAIIDRKIIATIEKKMSTILEQRLTKTIDKSLLELEKSQSLMDRKLGYLTEQVKQKENGSSNPLISVLVPVYNTQIYLRKCLDSLCEQSFSDFEVICINDGSTDESLDIIQEYVQKDKRFRVISKENTGYGDSMNQGLMVAKGSYISILESDDFAEFDMLQRLYAASVAYKADVVVGNYYIFHDTEQKSEFYELMWRTPYGQMLTKEERAILTYITPSIWKGLYSKEFLEKKKVTFLPTPGASYQDIAFAFKAYMSADKIVALKEPVLYYRRGHGTASIQDTTKVFCVCDEYEEIRKYIDLNGYVDWYPTYANSLLERYYWNFNRLSGDAKENFWKKFKIEIKECIEKGWIDKEKLISRDAELFNDIIL